MAAQGYLEALQVKFSQTEPKFIKPSMAADYLSKDFQFCSRVDDGMLFRYNPERGFYELSKQFCDEATLIIKKDEASSGFASDLYWNLAARNYNSKPIPSSDLICVKNGILNIRTLELTPHSPSQFFLQQIPIEYNPEAKCPEIEKFLVQVAGEKHALTLQEFAGFCLMRDYFIEKAIIAPGSGSNGKSVFTKLLVHFIGEENVTSMTLQMICELRWASAMLYGKLANFSPDLPKDSLRDVGMFKGLTGGDFVPAENKNKPLFKFVNYAKFFFGCNQIPRTKDKSDGYMRRFVIVPFEVQFRDNAIPREVLIAKLTTPEELSGFLNLALKGLRSVLDNKKFTHQQPIEEIRELYLKASEPVTAFVHDFCLLTSGHTSKSELYAAYTRYCRLKNFEIESEQRFGRSLKEVADVTDTRIGSGEERVTGWNGIVLKGQEEKQADDGKVTKGLNEWGDDRYTDMM